MKKGSSFFKQLINSYLNNHPFSEIYKRTNRGRVERTMYLSDLAHGVLLVLGRVSREGLGSGGSLGSLGSATATDHEEGTDGEDDNDGSRDTTSNGTNVGLVLGGGAAGDVVGHGDGGGGGVGTAVRVGVIAEDLFLAETHAHVNLALLAERLVLGALLEHAEVAVAVLPL